ncbi:MAG: type II toxin-antitoxin system VapC family toxin [Candidatus Sumerlaeota bacterium]|nr:type II toxin-antitoxin system VapC family toxin [Candidatus Sumerlaeota bacterium]
MILLDSDVLIDLLRKHPPAIAWFDTLREDEELAAPGYVAMELIQGCRNRAEQDKVERELGAYRVVWPSPTDCDQALEMFAEHRLSHNAGLLDALIGQTAAAMDVPLHTFNQRHYAFIPGVRTIQPYEKSG